MASSARIDELLQKFGENPRRYFAPLANEYRKLGDVDQAIALCREHLADQPGHMSGHIVYGQALFEKGDLVEAQRTFEAALALDPENLIALRHLGDIARAYGDSERAREWYQRVLEADPRNEEILAQIESLSHTSADVAPLGPPASGAFPVVPFEGDEPARAESAAAPPATESTPVDERPDDAAQPWAARTAGEVEESPSAETEPLVIAATEPAEPPDAADEFVIELDEPALSVPEDEPAAARTADMDESYPPAEREFDVSVFASAGVRDDRSEADDEPGARDDVAPLRDEPTWSSADAPTSDAERDDLGLESLDLVVYGRADGEESGAPPRAEESRAEEPAPLDFVTTSETAEETPEAFVTETMAELYLQQGFRDAALDVYRRLLVQHPDDDALRVRVARLEAEQEAAAKAGAHAASATKMDHGDRHEAEGGPSIRDLFARVASRRAPRRVDGGSPAQAGVAAAAAPAAFEEPPVGLDVAPASDVPPQILAREDQPNAAARADAPPASLDALFGHAGRPADEPSSSVLSNAYADPAPPATEAAAAQPATPTLDQFFRETPRTADATRRASSFSFDEFFAAPAPAPTAPPAAEEAPAPEPAGAPDDSAARDIEQFNAWLEGLKQK